MINVKPIQDLFQLLIKAPLPVIYLILSTPMYALDLQEQAFFVIGVQSTKFV